ncbi:hypothetical protein PEBR_38401 [Penicillium brasilianum]|uniref:Uncharacterized protein n=1 Tax=Penicillium brasilianum TaxID=104259 RepID=A0A1S9RBY0_PENBI|nr:hypothetical protein PEBR_38401 [Penicillium brasilianum]
MGSLCLEGHHVCVSGQDVERGTFSKCHANLPDQHTGSTYMPLNDLSLKQAEFTSDNFSPSEYGVMETDYGYSCMSPNALVMWEAHLGDFANNAQCIIDQDLMAKDPRIPLRGWKAPCSRVTSGRFFPTARQLERQHQDANMQYAGSLHDHPSESVPCITSTDTPNLPQACTPSPWGKARDNPERYPNASDVVWCQEESLNDEPWSFAKIRMETILDTMDRHKGRRLLFASREATPTVATGFVKEHHAQEEALSTFMRR